jgi:hypothetical protein
MKWVDPWLPMSAAAHAAHVATLVASNDDDGVSLALAKSFRTACDMGHAAALELLLGDERVDPNANAFSMCDACQNGHADVVAMLIADARFVFDVDDMDGWLEQACKHGHANVVRVFLRDARVDPNCCFAIEYACAHGHIEVVELLLERRRRVDVDDEAMLGAVLGGHDVVVERLLRDDCRDDADPNIAFYRKTRRSGGGDGDAIRERWDALPCCAVVTRLLRDSRVTVCAAMVDNIAVRSRTACWTDEESSELVALLSRVDVEELADLEMQAHVHAVNWRTFDSDANTASAWALRCRVRRFRHATATTLEWLCPEGGSGGLVCRDVVDALVAPYVVGVPLRHYRVGVVVESASAAAAAAADQELN